MTARPATKPVYLPNLLSSVRIVLAPAILGAAYSNSRVGYTALVAVALATDAADGMLARSWRAKSALGRQLDHWGDALALGAAAVGLALIWPNEALAEAAWLGLAVLGVAADVMRRFVQPETAPPAAAGWRAAGWLVPLAVVVWLNTGVAWPLRGAAAVQAAVGVGRLVAARRSARVDGGL